MVREVFRYGKDLVDAPYSVLQSMARTDGIETADCDAVVFRDREDGYALAIVIGGHVHRLHRDYARGYGWGR